jgi:hypothetical protein
MYKIYAGKIALNSNSVFKSEVLHICMLPMTPYISRVEGAATNCPAPMHPPWEWQHIQYMQLI